MICFDDMGGSAAENIKMLNKEGTVKVLISSIWSPEAERKSSNTGPVLVQNADVLFLLGFFALTFKNIVLKYYLS